MSEKTTFDLNIQSLRDGLGQARHVYSPNEVRSVILAILTGKNYRRITEKATRLEISVFMEWILNTCHRAKAQLGDDWLLELLKICSSTKRSQEAKWLRMWLMGLAIKTGANLGLKVQEYENYLSTIKAENDQIFKGQDTLTRLELHTTGLTSTKLSVSDSVWLLQIAGAAVLTLRGSSKSSVGKLLEKAIARACLTALGLKEKKDFDLNLAADIEVEREIDAEIETKRGRVRMDIALIGTGNQEVSEDKLQRVGKNGIVFVDKLGEKSKVPANAAKNGVLLIVIQNNLPLTALYNHLEPVVRDDVTLVEPPTTEAAIRKLLRSLPDPVFVVPKEP